MQFIGQDVEALVRVTRRRASDEKGGVRKVAVALLEALLRLRAAAAAGGGGAPLPPPAVRLPSEADLEPLKAAAADPLVSRGPDELCQRARLCLWIQIVDIVHLSL